MNLFIQWLTCVCLCLGFCIPAWSNDLEQAWLLSTTQSDQADTSQSIASSSSSAGKYQISKAHYDLPTVNLIDAHGHDVELRPFLQADGPVVLQFVFVTCSTICPILSASLASAQTDLERLSSRQYRLVSISIDPEQDTPEQLREYAHRFKAGNNWHFLTGNSADVMLVLKAFDASYAGDNKMFHQSLTFMRSGPSAAWRRVEGLLGKQELIAEYQQMLAAPD